jgi:ligand-binding SRPBCC domain-containing protein
MPVIHLTTFIAAPIERVFDLCRSINLHKISTSHTNERAVSGTISGLINNNETVTWEAKHLYKTRRFTSKITEMQFPSCFIDTMIKGDFDSFEHEHHFKSIKNGTIMIDLLRFESPYGITGKIFNRLYLKNYLEDLLLRRNNIIKDYAETSKWKAILS